MVVTSESGHILILTALVSTKAKVNRPDTSTGYSYILYKKRSTPRATRMSEAKGIDCNTYIQLLIYILKIVSCYTDIQS